MKCWIERSVTGIVWLLCALMATPIGARVGAQQLATIRVSVASARGPVAAALVTATSTEGVRTGAVQTGSDGRAILRVAVTSTTPSTSRLVITRLGFTPMSLGLPLRAALDTSVLVVLRDEPVSAAPIMIFSTRAERRVEDEPLRVEVLAGEDVAEKTQMRPADLRTLLSEMPGVHVQSTSPSLGGAVVRVQGLRGRYTQILTDGLPLYGAQAGSFGLLQIPPLDLRQAEMIKGAASALYGAGALGGVLNLISRGATDSSEMLINGAGRGGVDVVGFGARQITSNVGVTMLAGAHGQRAADVNADGWSDVAGFQRVELRPRVLLRDSAGRTLMLTAGVFDERRGGGSSSAASSASAAFPESLSTRHVDVGGLLRTRLSRTVTLAARAAANVQERARRFGVARELEHSATMFGELTSTVVTGAHTLLVGVAAQYERYRNGDAARFDERRTTPAVFVQHTYAPAGWWSSQVNGRCDASSAYGTICTPRLSMLAQPVRSLSVRLSGGAGWAAPWALTEETELFGLSHVTGPLHLSAERARTASLDVSNVRGPLEIGATVFGARVSDPVGLRRLASDPTGSVTLVNAAGPARVHGAELFAVYNEDPVIVTAFYAATRSQERSPESGRVRESPYVPRESAGLDVAFEEDDSGMRVGLEAFYTGPQAVEENPFRTVAPGFLTLGLLASQQVGHATLYVNLENLTNVRQTHFDPLLRSTPGEGGRRTVDEWAPLEGRSVNAGVRWRL